MCVVVGGFEFFLLGDVVYWYGVVNVVGVVLEVDVVLIEGVGVEGEEDGVVVVCFEDVVDGFYIGLVYDIVYGVVV